MGKGGLKVYEVKIDTVDNDLDPRSKMVKRVTLIFVGAVIYGIFFKIVFF